MHRLGLELGVFITILARLFVVAPLRWLWAVLCVTRRELIEAWRDVTRMAED
jgi:hypothetical protein